MSWNHRGTLACFLLVLVGPLFGQDVPTDRPRPHVPKVPVTKADLNHREALRLFGLATFYERRNRLLEAVKTYEEANRLDPDAIPVLRSLAALYFALERSDDGMTMCRKILSLDKEDSDTAHLLARHLRSLGKRSEAIEAYQGGLRSKRLEQRPDQAAQMYFDMGALQEQIGRNADAEKSFRAVVKILDNSTVLMEVAPYTKDEINLQAGETYERIGRLCLLAGRLDQAVSAFESAAKRDPARGPRLSFHLGTVLAEKGRHAEALERVNAYIKTQPLGTEAYQLRIDLLRKLNKVAEVIPGLESSSDRDPYNVPLRLLLGREYHKASQSAKAERIYEELRIRHVTPDVYRALFDLYKDDAKAGPAKVLGLLDRAVEGTLGEEKKIEEAGQVRVMLSVLREDSALIKMLLPEALRQVEAKKLGYSTRGVLATLAARAKQLPDAEKLYRACLGKPGGMGDLETEVYTGLLRVLVLRNSWGDVVAVSKEGLKTARNANRVLFHSEMAKAYGRLEKHEEAIAAARDAVKDSAKSSALWCRRLLVDTLTRAKRHKEALNECQTLLKEYNHGGDLRDVRYSLSGVYQAMGKMEESEEQLRLILESDPNDATVNNDLGYLWADRNKNLDKAEQMIRKAIELDRKQRTSGLSLAPAEEANAAYVDSLGWVLYRRGKLESAREELEKATRLPDGDDPVIWDHLGDVYLRLKQQDKALAAWRQALGLYEGGHRQKTDERYREIQDKIRAIKTEAP